MARKVITDTKIIDGEIYEEAEYFKNSKVKIIHASIFFKQVDSNFKKVYDALRIIESKYKDAIEIKIKLVKLQKSEADDLHVIFNNRAIYKDCHKLDTYIYIVDKILNKKRGKK